jgi:protein-S-isoprenylcysteine O-methyltransferase Ste14
MDTFILIYFAAIVAEMAIRAPFARKRRVEKQIDRRISAQEKALLGFLFVAMFAIPIIYAATGWLDFANYSLPVWAGGLGAVLIVGAVIVFWRAHVDLGANWSPSLEIREKHALVTRGIYGLIRHPMYASQFVWVIAQPLLLQNWIAGWLDLVIFVPFYLLRARAEEAMMLDTFGDQYRDYMQRVGAIVPKLNQ